jgi:predicted DNA-binding transcriptional regulator YafY
VFRDTLAQRNEEGERMTEQIRRASRLVEIESRLRRAPQGITVRDLAAATGYSMRTVQRDLAVLESELGVPLMPGEHRRWQIMPGSTAIGAVRFTLHQARAVYLATRLLLRHSDQRDPDAEAALARLAEAMPPSMARFVSMAAEELKERPVDEGYTAAVRVLTEAWAGSTSVVMSYWSQAEQTVKRTELDPYLLEASATGSYVMGFSHEHEHVRTFNLDRVRSVEPTGQRFEPREEELAHLLQQLARSWGGAVVGEAHFDVVLEFDADVAERVEERHWHPTQRTGALAGGRLRFEVTLDSLLEFTPWVRSWGASVRVVGPEVLRDEVAASARATAALYG